MNENMSAGTAMSAHIATRAGAAEAVALAGRYRAECRAYAGGPLLWQEDFDNVVCTAGKNAMLDNFIAGSGYTQTGPYLGLISSVAWSATSATDTMSSHSGWNEAGSANAPTFAARGTPPWSSASGGAKATSSAVSFTMTGAGTLEGAFLVLGSGAVTTIGSTAGTLFSAGAFSGGAQAVSSGNVVTVTYSISV
jgi:hypothetical protein